MATSDAGKTVDMALLARLKELVPALNETGEIIHALNAKWWQDIETGRPITRNVGELLMLATSELAAALEGHRQGEMDKHLPHRSNFEVELADAQIRLFDTGRGLGLSLGDALYEKCAYNAVREDHTHAHRLSAGGKKY